MPILFVLTVTTVNIDKIQLEGIYIGDQRSVFEEAACDSALKNVTYLNKPVRKVVTYLNEEDYKTTWVGDKAIYRTRNIIEKGGELIILAPGVRQFGDDLETDQIMRKYGYVGRESLLKMYHGDNYDDLRNNLAAIGQLILGSTNELFNISYAVRHLTREEIEGVNFQYLDYDEAINKYKPESLSEGLNLTLDNEEIYFIRNPGIGFWTIK